MTALTPPVNEQDHSLGPDEAPVTLVEYGDFECEHCGEAHGVIKEVLAAREGDIRFVFRNFPLTQSHPHAQQAAEAAEAAAAQGAFWPMHDHLYEHQDALDPDALTGYATAIGLDVEQFQRDLTEHTYADEVRADFLSGVRSGVNGTPTFFINGQRHDGPWDAASLLAVVDLLV
jgi:protein-disulfide isomerase